MKGSGQIINGMVFYSGNLSEYITKNEGSEVEIELVVVNKPEHYLYRYLFGFLIKDVAKHSGMSINDIHDLMKERFAKEFVDEWIDVPVRHRKRCDRYERENANGTYTRWYIKSCADMTHEELSAYVLLVENHFFDFMSGAIDKMHQEEARLMRTKGFMTERQLKNTRS